MLVLREEIEDLLREAALRRLLSPIVAAVERNFFQHVRGLIVFAFLPALWESAINWFRLRTADALIGVVIIVVVMALLWSRLTPEPSTGRTPRVRRPTKT